MNKIVIPLILLIAGLATGYLLNANVPTVGSIPQGQEYYSTTTKSTFGAAVPNMKLIKGGYGSLSAITITKAGSAGGYMSFYDTTTTNAHLRASSTQATSTLLIAQIPSDLAAGTYTFDAQYTRGLLVDWSGTIGTSTIIYR